MLDFGMPPHGEDRPQEAFSALLMLRRELVRFGLRFPLFDFTAVWYLHKTGRPSADRVKNLLPTEEMDFLTEVINAVSGTSWGALGKSILNIFNKHSREWLTLYRLRRRLDERKVEEIQRMEPRSELLQAMTRSFSEDLNTAMRASDAPSRVALFFDTHEAFWGSHRDISGDLFFQRDEWLRLLLGTLELSSGIVVVVAGRDLPRWSQAGRFAIPDSHLDVHPISHLSESDAKLYLTKCGVVDPDTQQQLAAYAQVAPDRVHPLFLGLCTDVLMAGVSGGDVLHESESPMAPSIKEKARVLIDRLLRYVDAEIGFAVRVLSACRAFNKEIYFSLGKALNFHATEAAFEVLTRFSFVWRADQFGVGRYRIHNLLRRILREREDELIARADVVMEEYYRERSRTSERRAIAEALYHANRLDWERGILEWLNVFDGSLQSNLYELCSALLEIRGELSIKSEFLQGRASMCVADYFGTLASYEVAHQEYVKAIAHFDESLRQEKVDLASSYNNKGIALTKLGNLQAELADHKAATISYDDAIAAFDQVLSIVSNYLPAFSHKAIALASLGDTQKELSQYVLAEASFRSALAVLDDALRHATNDVAMNNNKGLTLQSLGELRTVLSQDEEAVEIYKRAIAVFDQVLRIAPNHLAAYTNKGSTLQRLGDTYARLARHDAAAATFQEAISTYDEALNRSPDDVMVYNNKGFVLARLGEMLTNLSRYPESEIAYESALTCLGEALQRAPNYVLSYNNKGIALRGLGDLKAVLLKREEAVAFYELALTSFDDVLQRANDHGPALINKGVALFRLGTLHILQSQYDAAKTIFKKAVRVFDQALDRAPDHVDAYNNKGLALQGIGDAKTALSELEDAHTSYQKAADVYDQALRIAPNYIPTNNNKGLVLRRIGDLKVKLQQQEEAMRAYEASIAILDKALRYAPGYVAAHKNKAQTLMKIASLKSRIGDNDGALSVLEACIVELRQTLEIAPSDKEVSDLKEKAEALFNKGKGSPE